MPDPEVPPTITPLTDLFGAEVNGKDLKKIRTEEDFRPIPAMFDEHSAL